MEEFEAYDASLLYEILYEGQLPTVPEIPKAKTFKFKFTKDPENVPIPEPEKLEQLLIGKLASKKPQQSFDPLDLVHSKELTEMTATEKQINNYLNDKRKYQESKLPVVEHKDFKDLAQQVASPTCLKVTENYIIVGNLYGTIVAYSHFAVEAKNFQSPKAFGAVTSIDLAFDECFMISGYAGGQLIYWDFKTGSSIRANNSYHTSEICAYQFWKGNNLTISSDINGKATIVEYTKNFLSTSINGTDLIKGELGKIHSMQVLVSESQSHNLDLVSVVALATSKGLVIYTLSPEVGCFFNSPRPQSAPEDVVAKLVFKLVNLKTEFYSLTVAWGSYIVIYKVSFPIPEGVAIFTTLETSTNVLDLVWLSKDSIFLACSDKDLVIHPGEKKIIYESKRTFEPISRTASQSEKVVHGIQGFKRQVFILGNKEASVCNLLTWSECIDVLSHKGEWLEVLSFGLNLFENNYPSHFGAPESPEELKNILEQLITIYVKVGTIDWVHKISNTVEFCVGTDALDLLFNMLLDFFIDHGGKESMEYFVYTLEPYILTGKIKKIPSFVVGKLMAFYLRCNSESMIEKILLNVDPGSIDSDQVMPILKGYKLFTAGIVIYCNDGDFLSPLVMMINALKEEKENFVKTYLAYKVLWYLRLCFRGERFLHGKIYEEYYKDIVKKLVGYALEHNVFTLFIDVDVVSLLKVVWEVVELGLLDDYQGLVRNLFDVVKEDQELMRNFSCFIAKVSEKTQIPIEHEVVIAVSTCLLRVAEPIESNLNYGSDIVAYIHNLAYGEPNQAVFAEYSLKELGTVLLKILKNCGTLTDAEQKSLLALSKPTPHVLVKAFLLDLQSRHEESLDTFLQASAPSDKVLVFDWLDLKFNEGPNEPLKKKTIEELGILVEIDSDKTAHLVKKWYKNSHTFIIKKLDSAPNLQLKYLAELSPDQFDKDLLLIYVKLLSLHDSRKLVKFLKNFDNDYIEETLKVCKEFKAVEAEAYLNEKQGGVKEALDLWLELISETKSVLIRKVYKKEFIPAKEILKLGNLIKKYSKVCVRNSKALDLSEIEEFWLRNFKDCLDCFVDFKDYFYLYPQLEPMLHACLSFILEYMLEYVDLPTILDCLSNDYDDFPFKHIRQNIIQVLERYSHQQMIKQHALKLLKSDSAASITQLYSSRLEGHSSDFFICRSCGKKINQTSGNIFIFACGHVYHKRCQDLPACLICNDNN